MKHKIDPTTRFLPPMAAALLTCLLLAADASAAKTVKVFILAGQSNMEGKGDPNHLDTYKDDPLIQPWVARIRDGDDWAVRDDVFITYPTKAKGAKHGPLTVGYGTLGEDSIGPEFGFGHVVGEAFDEPVLIIKTAWGGKSVYQDFRPPSAMPGDEELRQMIAEMQKTHDAIIRSNEEKEAEGKKTQEAKPVPTFDELKSSFGRYYRSMLENVKHELADFENKFPDLKGYQPELAGFVWHQGFNDMVRNAYAPTKWAEYTQWSAAMIKDLRKDLDAPDLPVVIGECGTGGVDKRGDFQAAQAAIAKLPEFKGTVVFVETAQLLDPVAVKWFSEDLWKKGEEGMAKWRTVGNDRPYHYYGSGKTFFLKGVAFGEAVLNLKK